MTMKASEPVGNVRVLLRPYATKGLAGGLYRGDTMICDMHLPSGGDRPGPRWDQHLLAHGLPRLGKWEPDADGESWSALVVHALPWCSSCQSDRSIAYQTSGAPPITRYACANCRADLAGRAVTIDQDLLPAPGDAAGIDLSTPAGVQIVGLYLIVRELTDWGAAGDIAEAVDRWFARLGFDDDAPGLETADEDCADCP